ncbi:MAG: replicative DNA helicase [Caulobacterales bacterium]|nr:replicative DNA helicase [Caulobacterales bacterium]
MNQRTAPTAEPDGPFNLQAEQALLGILLVDNTSLERIGDHLRAEHFYEPFHQRLFAGIEGRLRRGYKAEPILLADDYAGDAAFVDLGGLRYLLDLSGRAPLGDVAADYAREIAEASTRRELVRVAGEIMAQARSDRTQDARGLLEKAERTLHGLQVGGPRLEFTTAAQAAARVVDYLDHPEAYGGGLSTGLELLDRQMGRMMPGDLIVLGGRTSMGKSALAAEIALNVAHEGVGVIEVNGEMSVDQMTRRHVTSICFNESYREAPAYSDIRDRKLEVQQRGMVDRALTALATHPLAMLKRPGLSLTSFRSLVRRQQSIWNAEGIETGLIVVDHAGLLKTDRSGRSRYEDQTEISNGLKEIADELGLPILALAQLNRETEKRDNKRPMLSDLRDSGAWEQDADVVIGVYRDAYYAAREPEPRDDRGANSQVAWAEWDRRRRSKTVEAILLKVREGNCGTVELWGDMARNAIRDHEPDGGLL